MKLTKIEKERSFWALIEQFPKHERGRKLAKFMFAHDINKMEWALKSINEQEAEDYALIKKFAEEIDMKLPERVII